MTWWFNKKYFYYPKRYIDFFYFMTYNENSGYGYIRLSFNLIYFRNVFMKDSIKKSLAVAVISAFLSNAHGACARNNTNQNSSFMNKVLITLGAVVPCAVIGIGITVCALQKNTKDDNDNKDNKSNENNNDGQNKEILQNQDQTIKYLAIMYENFKKLIQLSRNPNIEGFKQNLKCYIVTFDDNSFELLDYDLLREVLFGIYQVCANANMNYFKKLSELEFEMKMSDDMNALVITSIKNSKKIFLVNNRDFVGAMSTDNKIKSRSDLLFNGWKNNKDDDKFVDGIGKLVKEFCITSF